MKNFSLILFILYCFNGKTQPNNINISNTTIFGGEPFLAINPSNPNNIIISWIALDLSTGLKSTIKSKVSFDGGQTWGNTYNHPHMYSTWKSADPSMAFRKNGTVYLSYIDYRESPDSGGVYITHSSNGGISWSAPTRAWNANAEDPSKLPLDRPWLAVDNSTTTTQGMFYMSTKPAPWIPAPNRAYFKSSADSGANWSSYRYIDTTGYLIGSAIQAPMAAICVAADGAVCLAYPSYVISQSVFPKIYFAKSYNKGGTFQYYDMLVNPSSVPSPNNYKLGYNMHANPNNANQIAACFINNTYGDPDVFTITSNNGGVTWSSPVRVNNDPISNGKGQDLAWINYSSNNKLLVVWRDKRNGSGTGYYQPSDVYCAVSLNNGASFQPNIRLSNISAPHDTILTQNGNDFLSCELRNDTIYAAWGDVRTGKLNIYFTKTSINTGLGIQSQIINNDSKLNLSVYPQPASGQLELLVSDEKLKRLKITIYTIDGKIIMAKNIEPENKLAQLEISELKNGIYILLAESEEGIREELKFIVQR